MADRVQRYAYQNNVALTASLVSASSRDQAFPAASVKTSDPKDVWRSKLGWNVVTGERDALDFFDGTTRRVAYLGAGNYSTGALYSAQVTAALAAAGVWPGDLSPTAWWRGDSLLSSVAQDGLVSTWADSSGNGRNLTQAVSGRQPVFKRAALNSRPALYFDGARDLATSAALSALLGANGVGTVFVVYQRNGDATASNVHLAGSAAGGTLRVGIEDNGTNLTARNHDGSADAATKATSAGWNVGVWWHDATNVRAGLNDVDTADLGSAASGNTSDLTGTLLVGIDPVGLTNRWAGYIAEVIVFATALSEEDRRRVHAYLETKYKIAKTTSTAPAWSNVLTATYDSATSKFTIARTTGAAAFSLAFGDGPNLSRSCALDLGYTETNKTAATTYTAEAVAYHSREWLQFDLISARSRSLFAVIAHNADTLGVFEMAASDVPDFSTASWTLLSGNEKLRLSWSVPTTARRYVRLRIIDVQNVAGFSEIGHVYDGNYFQPLRGAAFGMDRAPEALGSKAISESGTPMANRRAIRTSFSPLTYNRLSRLDRNGFHAIYNAMGDHRPFLVAWDYIYQPTDLQLAYFSGKISEEHIVGDGEPPERWKVALTLIGVPL